MAPPARSIVLFITHLWDEACAGQVTKLRRELGDNYEVRVAGYLAAGAPRPAMPDGIKAHFYSEADLAGLQPALGEEPRWHHFILPRFYQQFPEFARYWMIEYDVRYTGHWGKLFATLNDPDVGFFGTGMERRACHPAWWFWHSFATGTDEVAAEAFVKCFGPLAGLSVSAMAAVLAALGRGWRGHYEALWPTAIAHAGLRLEEIGAKGEFTPKARWGKHYTQSPQDECLYPGSFVFRPTLTERQIRSWRPLLWHPVKPGELQEGRPDWAQPLPVKPARGLFARVSAALNSR